MLNIVIKCIIIISNNNSNNNNYIALQLYYCIPEIDNEDDNSFGGMLKRLDEDDVKITVQLDVIKRGKRVTTIKGFTNEEQIASTAHELKKSIGTGGTYKNGIIVLQGDHRSKVTDFLLSKGFDKDAIEVI